MDGHAKVPAKRAGAARDGEGQVRGSMTLLSGGYLKCLVTYPQSPSVNKLNTVLRSVNQLSDERKALITCHNLLA
jgi:hypothetical protein